jgi:hypothetical protein
MGLEQRNIYSYFFKKIETNYHSSSTIFLHCYVVFNAQRTFVAF